jgi:hypothetical protein
LYICGANQKCSIMKKVLFGIIVIVLSFNLTQNAKAQVFDKGTKLLDVGIGIPYYSDVVLPPLFGSVEVGIHQYIGIGVTGGFYSNGYYGHLYSYHYYNRYIVGGGFAALHFSDLLKKLDLDMNDIFNSLDLYWRLGFGLGFRMYNDYEWDHNLQDFVEVNKVRVFPAFLSNLGGRYYISDNLGIFMEVGYDFYSWTNFGVTFKF